MSQRPETLGDLFTLAGGLRGPRWMPLYDLGAFLSQADRDSGWGSEMMAALAAVHLQLDEYQAIVDLCAAFETGPFAGNSRYRRIDGSDEEVTRLLAENARVEHPSYARLRDLMIEHGVLTVR